MGHCNTFWAKYFSIFHFSFVFRNFCVRRGGGRRRPARDGVARLRALAAAAAAETSAASPPSVFTRSLKMYGTWMFTSFFAPMAVNLLSAKWALFLGALGYPLYSLAMFYKGKALGIGPLSGRH